MQAKTGWNIRPPDMGKFLENIREGNYEEGSLESRTTFTILRNAIKSETEIAELVAATGADNSSAAKMVALPFERLVFLETVAALETEVQMKEDDLKPLVLDLYRHHIKPRESGNPTLKEKEKTIRDAAKWESLRIMVEVKEALSDASKRQAVLSNGGLEAEGLKIFDKIKERLLSGDYKPYQIIDEAGKKIFEPDDAITSDNVDAIALALTKEIVNDKCYMKQGQDAAKRYVDDKLRKVIESGDVKYPGTDKSLQRLSTPTRDDRHTFMLSGAPACGKGTIIASIRCKQENNLALIGMIQLKSIQIITGKLSLLVQD